MAHQTVYNGKYNKIYITNSNIQRYIYLSIVCLPLWFNKNKKKIFYVPAPDTIIFYQKIKK